MAEKAGESGRKDVNSDGIAGRRGLQALRGMVLLLAVVLHASSFLIPFFGFWPVTHPYAWERGLSANIYVYILSAINGFAMPLFFVLTGFFTAFRWQHRGLREIAMDGIELLVLPLLIGMFTIVPLTHWAFVGFDLKSFTWPEHFYHLWIFWYQLLMVAWFALVARMGLRFRHRLWWLLLLLPGVPQYFMGQTLGADVPGEIMPAPASLAYFLICFLLGVILHQRGIEVRRWWTAGLPLGLLVIMPMALAILYAGSFGVIDPDEPWVPFAAAALQVVYAWLACFGMMGLFRWIADRERPWSRYVADAALWIYFGHLPLVIWGQTLAVEWSVDPHLAFALIILAVTGVLVLIYAGGIRHIWVGTFPGSNRSPPAPARNPAR